MCKHKITGNNFPFPGKRPGFCSASLYRKPASEDSLQDLSSQSTYVCHVGRKEKSSSPSSWASSSSSPNPLITRLYKPPLITILSQGQRMYARRLMLSSATFLVKQEVFQLLSGCFLQTSRWMQLAALMWAIPRREPAAHLADKQRQDEDSKGPSLPPGRKSGEREEWEGGPTGDWVWHAEKKGCGV